MSDVVLKPNTVLQSGNRFDTVANFVKEGISLSALQGLVATGAMKVIGEAAAVPGAAVGQAAEALA